MEIVDDQKGTVPMLGELRTNSVGDGLRVEVRCRGQLFAIARRARYLPDGTEDGQPELLGVLLIAPYLDDCQPVRLPRTICPGP